MGQGDAPFNLYEYAGHMLNQDPAVVRSTHYARQTQHGAGLVEQNISHSGTDPAYIADIEHWEKVPHAEIYKQVQAMDPVSMHEKAGVWSDISAGVSGGLFGLHLSIQKALSEGLAGKAGDAGQLAARKFIDQATDVQEVIKAVSVRLNSVAYGAEALKRLVPPPVTTTPESTTAVQSSVAALYPALTGGATPGATIGVGVSEDDQYRLAITAMQQNYDPIYRPAGENVPTFVPVDSPGDDGNGPVDNGWTPGTGGPSTSGTDGRTGADDGRSGTGEPQAQTDPTSTTAASDSSNSAGSQGNQGTNQNQQGTGTGSPSGSQTTAAGFGGGTGGRGGGSGSGGFGSGGIGRPGSTAGGPGRSGTGVPGAVNPAAAAAQGAGQPGTPGIGGMPGMGAGAPGRKGEDDEKEHKTPDYLVMDREEELLGRRERTVPQAIGADIPAAQTRPDDHGGRRG
ncbi:hypothetical protein [Nocardia wallacei]|uniref:hypothetical protein n=1 Tax=Nocardia wallacei TaxID=480035 RepID=UPI0024539E60|nr:hypothetical protein [Nocardia wallacei]